MPKMPKLTAEQRATILAALRHYQQTGQGDPSNRTDEIQEIATDGYTLTSLDSSGIDELCDILNPPRKPIKFNKRKSVRVYDNGGETADRYTVVFVEPIDGEFGYVSMSAEPRHPQGVCQHGDNPVRIDKLPGHKLGKRIKFSKLPQECRDIVKADFDDYYNK